MGETFSKREELQNNASGEEARNAGSSQLTNSTNQVNEDVSYSNYDNRAHNRGPGQTNENNSRMEAMAVVTSSYLERNLETHHNECNICGLNFTSQHRLRRHALLHASQYTFPCHQCDKSFVTLSNWRNHMTTHPVIDHPYECSFCDKTFADESSLHIHMKDHTGLYTHTCDICCKTFTQKSFFLCHMWTHIAARPHKCHFCDKIFFMPSSLRSHVKDHSRDDQYAMNDCDFSNSPQSRIMAS